MDKADSANVREDEPRSRFVLPIEAEAVAAAYYQTDDENRRVLTHTEVPSEYMGGGIGSALARGVFDMARARGFKLVLRCSFMAAWLARHPDYADVVAG